MEKLIELLNEYENRDLELEEWEESNARTENNWHLWFNGANKVQFDTYMFDSLALSKQYWFIKWLVENEKIDWEKFQEPKMRGIICLISNWHNSEWKSYKDYSKELAYESLLMLLSIQDEPIEFLVSILK